MSCENNKILMTSRNRLISRSHRANTLILVDTLESFLIDGARAELSRDSLTPRLISQKLNGIRSCFVFFVVRPFLSSHFQCAKEARKEAAAHVRVSLWEKSRPGLNFQVMTSSLVLSLDESRRFSWTRSSLFGAPERQTLRESGTEGLIVLARAWI